MYRIAIIDDDEKALENLKEKIESYRQSTKCEFCIRTYTSGKEYLKEDPNTDILFLDIEMPEMNGIEIAKEVRKKSKNTAILFCTDYQQFAINGYEVNALGYMVKPVSDYAFTLNLTHALKYLNDLSETQNQKIQLKSFQGIIVLDLKDILYIEVRKHNLFFHLKADSTYPENPVKVRGSMDEISKSLSAFFFSKAGQSFLINIQHIKKAKSDKVIMEDGTEIPLSRIFKNSFLEDFSRYLIKKRTIVL